MFTDTTSAEPAAASGKSFSRTPTSWDASDDILLMHLKDNQKLGWKEIALHFHNRTPNACQFRWRRLKSGNLKNPPKSAAAISSFNNKNSGKNNDNDNNSAGDWGPESRRAGAASEIGRKPGVKRRISELSAGIGSVYLPLSNTTFTDYDTVSTALAGLSALSNTALGGSHGNGGIINTTLHPQTFENLPKQDVALDSQARAAASGSSGGYFADISVDPTLNLPHNRPHPVLKSQGTQGLTPRNLAIEQSLAFVHNESIIQVVRDDRASVSSQPRHSVLSLPSKSMDIPHHQSTSLAHLPVLFGGNSISGPTGSGPSSVSGPSGLPHLASTLSSVRNGSIVGHAQAYLRRLSMLTVHGERRPSEKDKDRKLDKDKEKSTEKDREKGKNVPGLNTPSRGTPALQPMFKIPWSMEEDELLINRRRKELSFAELSILLPQRTEGEIWARIDALEQLKNGSRALVSRARCSRLALLGLDDDVDDFYDDVDSVINGIDSEDDDDNDDVLLDVDGSILGHTHDGSHRRESRKRRASLAVDPLSVRDGIRSKLR